MPVSAFAAIGIGAALGAWLRYVLGLWLNPLFPAVPLGTLSANWLGGYLMGIALGVFAQWPSLSPEIRLFVTTGFLGGLTTFSTFSAEMATLLQRQQFATGAAAIVLHVGGSIAMTLAGLWTLHSLRA